MLSVIFHYFWKFEIFYKFPLNLDLKVHQTDAFKVENNILFLGSAPPETIRSGVLSLFFYLRLISDQIK